MDGNQLQTLKLQFAKFLLQYGNSFKAAREIYPDDVAMALRVSNEWPNDPLVKTASDEIKNETNDGMDLLPTKVDACISVWERAHDCDTSPDEYQKLMRLYCEVRSFIEKPSTNINVDNSRHQNIDIENIQTIMEAEQAYKDLISG